MGQPEPETVRMAEAVRRTSYTKRTLHLRIDAWLAGREDPYALVGWRPHPTGERFVHPQDLERIILQKNGKIDHRIGPHEWAVAHGYADDIRPPAAGWPE